MLLIRVLLCAMWALLCFVFGGLRRFLEINKIYVDVLSLIFIAGASLVVAYAALDINERMLAVSEVSAQPHFSMGGQAVYSEEEGSYIEESMFLNNNGAPISNLDWKTKSFIVVERFNSRGRYTLVPVLGYYFAHYSTAEVVGKLSTAKGFRNLSTFAALHHEAMQHNAKSATEDYCFVSVLTVSKVSYEDRLGRRNAVYFKGTVKVSDAVGRDFFEPETTGPMLDMASISLEQVLREADKPDSRVLDTSP